MSDSPLTIDDLLFVGFNRRVVALSKKSGETIWQWKAPHGTGFVTLLVEDDTLFASVQGYTYALDPANGEQVWYNPLKGLGTGATMLATTRSSSQQALLAAAVAAQQQAAAGGAAAAGGS